MHTVECVNRWHPLTVKAGSTLLLLPPSPFHPLLPPLNLWPLLNPPTPSCVVTLLNPPSSPPILLASPRPSSVLQPARTLMLLLCFISLLVSSSSYCFLQLDGVWRFSSLSLNNTYLPTSTLKALLVAVIVPFVHPGCERNSNVSGWGQNPVFAIFTKPGHFHLNYFRRGSRGQYGQDEQLQWLWTVLLYIWVYGYCFKTASKKCDPVL